MDLRTDLVPDSQGDVYKRQGNTFGKCSVSLGIFVAEVIDNKLTLLGGSHVGNIGVLGEEVIKLGNEVFHCRDELNKTFGDKNGTEVLTIGRTCGNGESDRVNNVLKSGVISFNLFGDDADIGMRCV